MGSHLNSKITFLYIIHWCETEIRTQRKRYSMFLNYIIIRLLGKKHKSISMTCIKNMSYILQGLPTFSFLSHMLPFSFVPFFLLLWQHVHLLESEKKINKIYSSKRWTYYFSPRVLKIFTLPNGKHMWFLNKKCMGTNWEFQ